jgi:hypothetical protein
MKELRLKFITWGICFLSIILFSGCTDPDSEEASANISNPADGCMGKLLSCFDPSGVCEQDQNGIYFSNSANQIPSQPAYKGETPKDYISNQSDTSMFCYRVHVTGIGKIMVTDSDGGTYYYLAQQREGQVFPSSTTNQQDLLLNGNITVLCADNTEEYYTRGATGLLYGAGQECNYVGSGACTANGDCNPNCAAGEDPDCENGSGTGETDCTMDVLACNYMPSGDYYMCYSQTITYLDPDCDGIRCEDDGVCDPACEAQDVCDQSCVQSQMTGGDEVVTYCKDYFESSSVECKLSAFHPSSCGNTECGCDVLCQVDPDCTD